MQSTHSASMITFSSHSSYRADRPVNAARKAASSALRDQPCHRASSSFFNPDSSLASQVGDIIPP
ncbi:hypothetical protein QL093DRAFT_2213350, partial [Fusarium oxysporum]